MTALPDPLEEVPLDRLRARTSMKWRAFPADVLPLWVAEMDVIPAEPIRRAVSRAMESGDTGYPGGDAYAEALGSFARARWGFDGVRPERCYPVADVMVGVTEVIGLLTEPGDAVVVTAPVYPPFHAFSVHAGRRVIEARLTDTGRLDPETLERACADGRGGVLLLSNPHNPTGTVHTRAELETAAAIAARHSVRVVSDEIHAPLVFPGATFTPYLSVDPRGFMVTSASKAWNLAGLKAALVVAGPDAVADLARMPEIVSHGASHVAVLAHAAAYAESGDWLDALNAALDRRRRLVADLLAEHAPAIGYRIPEGTFLAWLDCSRTPLADPAAVAIPGNVRLSAGPAKAFLDHGRVGLNAGEAFGSGGENHVRLNFATRLDVLTEAVERMGGVLARAESPDA
ncbi:MalY/PatB family protein [Granulicoccus sp. GXG6511]|uniref:MalY/PatB family protein n=1 Tax=Granulicoccus sp. GXG6511 TaxID=3381351 RepID=UPI003D7EA8BC